MSLKNAIKKATKAALAAQGSIAVPITYFQAGSVSYNTDTGEPSRAVLATHNIAKAWFTSYTEKEVDGNNVQPKDQRLTILAEDAPGLTPKLHDWLVDEDGIQWEVIRAKFPPPRTIHIIQVRKP